MGLGPWVRLPVPILYLDPQTEGSGQCTATTSSQNSLLRAPGPSSERCRAGDIKGPHPHPVPSTAPQKGQQSQPHLHLLNHLKQICVLQQRWRRAGQSSGLAQLTLLSP